MDELGRSTNNIVDRIMNEEPDNIVDRIMNEEPDSSESSALIQEFGFRSSRNYYGAEDWNPKPVNDLVSFNQFGVNSQLKDFRRKEELRNAISRRIPIYGSVVNKAPDLYLLVYRHLGEDESVEEIDLLVFNEGQLRELIEIIHQ